MRHELRTPLNAVIGYSDILREDCEVEDHLNLTSDLHKISEAGHQLLSVIGSVLQADKILSDETADISLYTQQIIDGMKRPLDVVSTLSDRLYQQCVDAGEEGWARDLARIRIAAHRLAHVADEILEVAQSPNADETIIQMLSDDLSSAEGVIDTLQQLGTNAVTRRPLTGHILIVDDNQENQDILERHLKRQGHEVTVFDNGTAALEYLHREDEAPNVDILLLDVMMSGINGYEVLAELRSDSRLRHLPVIFLSALDDMESLLRGIELGAQDFLPKPFNPVLLKARIGAILEKKKLRDLELNYVANAAKITQAAAAFEAGEFVPEILDEVAQRTDELGRLARVFQNMAYEVRAREERLKQEVQQLRIEIDRNKEASKVAEIVETEYFQQLQQRATKLRQSFKEK